MRVQKSKRNTRFAFHPYKEEWNKNRTSKSRRSFATYLIWILALVILIALIFYQLSSVEGF